MLAAGHSRGESIAPIAGATDVLVHWPLRQKDHDKTYLDLSGVRTLREHRWRPDALVLGAMTTYWQTMDDPRVAEVFPLLIDAARQVGAVQIQTRGTWAGNIANGSPAADGVPVLMAYDAGVVLVSKEGGRRTVPLNSYYTGYRASVRRPDELIAEIIVPIRAYDFAVFHKVGPRRAQAITKVGAAVVRERESGGLGHLGGWRVVANSVAPTVCRCPAIEGVLNDQREVRSPKGFLAAAKADIAPIDDIRSTADYRRTVLCNLLYHSLRGVANARVV